MKVGGCAFFRCQISGVSGSGKDLQRGSVNQNGGGWRQGVVDEAFVNKMPAVQRGAVQGQRAGSVGELGGIHTDGWARTCYHTERSLSVSAALCQR